MNVFDVLREKLAKASKTMMPVIPTDDAIEIVNQVEQEYNNDVCEWKSDVIMGLYTSHGECEKLANVEAWDFCPYCGKKIKVV